MLVNSRGANFVAVASAAEANMRRRSASAMALAVPRLVFVGVTATLFFAWMMSANTVRRGGQGSSAVADCVSLAEPGLAAQAIRWPSPEATARPEVTVSAPVAAA